MIPEIGEYFTAFLRHGTGPTLFGKRVHPKSDDPKADHILTVQMANKTNTALLSAGTISSKHYTFTRWPDHRPLPSPDNAPDEKEDITAE